MRVPAIVLCLLLCAGCGDDDGATPDLGNDDLSHGGDAAQGVTDCPSAPAAGEPALAAGEGLRHEEVTIGAIVVDRYVWRDSVGLVRSVSLKKQCAQNAGNGGYAVQMTYQTAAAITRTLGADDSSDGGWGYFVSHETYRHFSDNTDGTVAARHGEDDSALGKAFPVSGTSTVTADAAQHVFVQIYYRWGTIAATPYDDATGQIATPADGAAHKRYDLPVTLTWSFAAGSDYPMLRTVVDEGQIPGPDRVFFDVRGPYGVLQFDEGKGTAIQGLVWGDRFRSFRNTTVPLTWSSGGDWSGAAPAARYHALVAGDYEMGLYEPRAVTASALADGYSDNRGKAAVACADDPAQLKLPCEYEWPYQSLNYSLDRATPTVPTTGEKLAWGSAGFYGSSLTTISAGAGLDQAFDGKAGGKLSYDLCVVVDRPVAAQGADGASTIQSRTATVAAVAANRAPGGRCAVLP